MTDIDRYLKAAHAMQSGVAMEIGAGYLSDTELKHLRVGINSAMSDVAAIAGLLINKGYFTEAEYVKAIADQMEKEAASEERISVRVGRKVTLL